MQRTICSLMLLGVLAGCNGGDGTVKTPTDSTPPSVTLTASETSVNGGGDVALTAAANDSVDGALTPTLACNGGTLTGTILQTAPVRADTSIECTATATDKAGNTGTAKVVITVKAPTGSFALMEGQTSVAAGGMAVISTDGVALTEAGYQGSIGGQQVSVVRSAADTLAVIVPAGLTGDQTLTVTIGGQTYSQTISVTAAPAVSDPTAVVTAALNTAIGNLDRQISADSATRAQAEIDLLKSQRAQLQQTLAGLATAPAAEVQALAQLLVASDLAVAGVTSQSWRDFSLSGCGSGLKEFVRNNLRVARLIGIAAVGAYTSGVFPVLGPTVAVLASGTALGLLIGTDGILDQVTGILDACFAEQDTELQQILDSLSIRHGSVTPMAVTALAANSPYGFSNGKPLTFQLKSVLRADSSVIGSLTAAFAALRDTVAKLPYVPDSITALLPKLETERTEVVAPGYIALAGISRADITGVLGAAGDNFTLKFTAKQEAPNGNLPFSFNLTRPQAQPIPISATLVVARPEADDASIEVRQGTPATSNVQVRGADTLEIVQQPAHGSVSLGNDGGFVYTPSGQYFGDDKFVYRARNDQGYSDNATVLISVVRQFEGSWSISTVSTTSSESSQGLCPRETNQFSVSVAKNSDTSYSAGYLGYQLPLTMASKDDPNGLTGSITVTYDDDPGETTESLTVRIPDSNSLSGSSSWSYSGPNGSYCRGTTTITGHR